MSSRPLRIALLTTLALLICCAVLGCCSSEQLPDDTTGLLRETTVTPAVRVNYSRRLEPGGDAVLIGAGQTDVDSFRDFAQAVAPVRPTVFMTYVDLRDDLPSWFDRLQQDLATLPAQAETPNNIASPKPRIIPQIGLSLNRGEAQTSYAAETARGDDDPSMDQLCAGLSALHRSAFLRVGYEFNGSWNGYAPTSYVAAFRRIAARVHSCAPQVALVWNWSTDAELDAEVGGNRAPASSRWQPYYPGDDAVDWWALNLFTAAGIRSAAAAQYLNAAATSHHPVMIAESAPQGYDLADPASAQAAWRDWFTPYFALIHHYPGVRAFCYIEWNWAMYPQWADWGDSRISQAPATLQDGMRAELALPLYSHTAAR